jgi:hypothetical protein
MNALPLDQFPTGELATFPSGVSTAPGPNLSHQRVCSRAWKIVGIRPIRRLANVRGLKRLIREKPCGYFGTTTWTGPVSLSSVVNRTAGKRVSCQMANCSRHAVSSCVDWPSSGPARCDGMSSGDGVIDCQCRCLAVGASHIGQPLVGVKISRRSPEFEIQESI